MQKQTNEKRKKERWRRGIISYYTMCEGHQRALMYTHMQAITEEGPNALL